MKKLTLLILALLCVGHISAQRLSADGPYILYGENSYQIISVDTMGNLINQTFDKKFKKHRIDVFSHDHKIHFKVNATNKIIPSPTFDEDFDGKILVLTDPHAELESFVTTLQNNGVMDSKYRWTFGKNQLVINGDILDRGDDATTILWLTYKLEQEAAKKGGRVSYLMGNHEDMVLKGDDRYLNDKYPQLADTLNIAHKSLYAKNTLFGDWIRSKNLIQVIDDYIFVHAGLSEEFYERDMNLEKVNQTVPQWLGTQTKDKEAVGGDIEFIYRTYGLIWYRGMAYDDQKYKPITQKTVNKILRRYDVDNIILGHTIFDDVTPRYEGKVVMVNVKNDKNRLAGKGMGLLIEDGKFYRVYTTGKPRKL